MKLGILLPPLGGRAAGLAVYVREIGARLLAAHPDWVLFTEESGELPAWCDGHAVVRIGRGGAARLAGRVHRRLARLISIQGALRREVARQRIGALLVPFHDGVLRCPAPQVIVVHDLTLLRHPAPGGALSRLYMRALFRPVARRAACLVAVSESTARDLESLWHLARRPRVVHEGYDRRLFRTFSGAEIEAVGRRLGVERPYLFYAGTFARHKNLDTALDALQRLAAARPDLRLVVAGPDRGGAFARFERAVRQRGLESRVEALGYVERRDLGPLMAGAAGFVFPSLAEGFGLAVLEAMASGAAVLAADRASLPEVVGDGGLLLDPADPAAWADAILDLLARPDHDRELRRRAVERARRFDWNDAAEAILRILLDVARPAPSTPTPTPTPTRTEVGH